VDQQVVESFPFPPNCFRNWGVETTMWADIDRDLFKMYGFGGLKRGRDPPDIRPAPPEFHIFQFCGL
jgi:hypothetical protein